MNDGTGRFTDSGQRLSTGWSYDSALADLDGDHDLDVLLAASNAYDEVWLNDGRGALTKLAAEAAPRQRGSTAVAAGDLDGDGDLDAVFSNYSLATTVWLNRTDE
jgi:hypothetical protein